VGEVITVVVSSPAERVQQVLSDISRRIATERDVVTSARVLDGGVSMLARMPDPRQEKFGEARSAEASREGGPITFSPDNSSAPRSVICAVTLLLVGFGLAHAPSHKQQGHRYDRL
jgi:hypothetical protein